MQARKKVIAIVLLLTVTLSLCACGGCKKEIVNHTSYTTGEIKEAMKIAEKDFERVGDFSGATLDKLSYSEFYQDYWFANELRIENTDILVLVATVSFSGTTREYYCTILDYNHSGWTVATWKDMNSGVNAVY